MASFANFMGSAAAASAGAARGRADALAGLRFQDEYDDIYRQRDLRSLQAGAPLSVGAAPGLPGATAYPDPSKPAAGLALPVKQVAGKLPSAASLDQAVMKPFMATVQSKINNPFALATIAAYGVHESGFSSKNAGGTWADPSQSGKPGTSGGILSWRGPRLQALQQFAQQSGRDWSDPTVQAEFFVQENPMLTQRLNAAKSLEEANEIMANAWAFAGYDKPGGEKARRLATAQSFLGQVSGAVADAGGMEEGMSTSDADVGGPVDPGVAQTVRDKAGLATIPAAIADVVRAPAYLGARALDASGITGFGQRIGKALGVVDPNAPPAQLAPDTGLTPFTDAYVRQPLADLANGVVPGAAPAPAEEVPAATSTSEAPIPTGTDMLAPQVGLKPKSSEESYTAPKADVSNGVKAILAKNPNAMNYELRRAQDNAQYVRQLAEQKHQQMVAQRNNMMYQLDAARRVGDVERTSFALEQINSIDNSIMELNVSLRGAEQQAIDAMRKIDAEMAIQDVVRSRDPRKMQQLWAETGGVPIAIQPMSDGQFEITVPDAYGGQTSSIVSYSDLVDAFYDDIFEGMRDIGASSAAENAGKLFESQLKILEKQAEQEGLSQIEYLKQISETERAEMGWGTGVELQDGGTGFPRKDGSGMDVFYGEDTSGAIPVQKRIFVPTAGLTR